MNATLLKYGGGAVVAGVMFVGGAALDNQAAAKVAENDI